LTRVESTTGRERIHFVTGRLAEHALRTLLAQLAPQADFDYTVDVLPITVAALMTPAWVARKLQVPPGTGRVILPGYCHGDLGPVEAKAGVPVERGPKDLRDLPEHFGGRPDRSDYGPYRIQILAEINHAPRLTRDQLLTAARTFADQGADLIDIGCDPGDPWTGIGDAVRALRDMGLRVSVDSLDPREIAPAVRAGAELVLSVNSRNRTAAPDWNCEVVVIPDDPRDVHSLDATIEYLAGKGVPLRIDPILEPIGCGFAPSLGRYLEVRGRYPDARMMMGIGNLTELTDADSAPINLLLLGICEELEIGSVLTTAVINWARTSVQECDLARRLVHYAVRRGVPPKRLEPRLVTLRDPHLPPFSEDEISLLARTIRDPNYRLFAGNGKLHLVSAGLHLAHADPFDLFARLMQSGPEGQPPRNLDPSHAFYLGYEAAKAILALQLGKVYRQDEALDWGYLTVPETSHRNKGAARELPAAESEEPGSAQEPSGSKSSLGERHE
jgi:dihydropteroate synthase